MKHAHQLFLALAFTFPSAQCYQTAITVTSAQVSPASSTRHSYGDYTHQELPTVAVGPWRPSWSQLSASQFKEQFSGRGYSAKEILSQSWLYALDEFVKFAQTLPGYEEAVTTLHQQCLAMSAASKVLKWAKRRHPAGLSKRIKRLYDEIQEKNKQYDAWQDRLIEQINTAHSPQELTHAFSNAAKQVFEKVHPYDRKKLYKVELEVAHLLRRMTRTQNPQELIFNAIATEHVLVDMHNQASKRPPLFERLPSLAWRGIKQFVSNLNPLETIPDMYNFFVATVHFASDVTIGKLYLTDEEYKNRISCFCDSVKAIGDININQLNAENWVDMAANLAAMFVSARGSAKVHGYLKELQIVSQMQQRIAKVTYRFERAIHELTSNIPVARTAEGITLKAIESAHDLIPKKWATGAQALAKTHKKFLNACAHIMQTLEPEIAHLKRTFDYTRKGVGEFKDKWIKLSYKHILGIEPKFNGNGVSRISGYHRDFKRFLEKSGTVEFLNKKMYKNGFYQADLYSCGRRVKKGATFFPSHWSNEKVITSIFEAYDDFIKKGGKLILEKNGTYIAKGMTKKMQTIEMCITPKGKITTAYPFL